METYVRSTIDKDGLPGGMSNTKPVVIEISGERALDVFERIGEAIEVYVEEDDYSLIGVQCTTPDVSSTNEYVAYITLMRPRKKKIAKLMEELKQRAMYGSSYNDDDWI
jgi:hypothetical protein